jgi:uroporphyrinogen-III synthase
LSEYDWIVFSSANAVRFFCERAAALGQGRAAFAHLRIVAGPATAEALARYGLAASVVPAPFSAERARTSR